jgi:hypothetical protein
MELGLGWQLLSTGISSLALAAIAWMIMVVVNAFMERWWNSELGIVAFGLGCVIWVAANGFLYFLRST